MTARMTPLLRKATDLVDGAAKLVQAGRHAKAVAALELVADRLQGDADLLGVLGEALVELDVRPTAEAALRRAIALAPQAARPRLQLARLLVRACRFAEGEAEARATLALNPSDVDTQVCLAQALVGLGRLDEAEALLRRVQQQDAKHLYGHLSMALVHFLRGDWAKGFAEYRWRRALPGIRPAGRPTDRHWQGESVAGKSFLLFGEQGSGDTIQFLYTARLLAERGADVWVALAPSLLPLLPPSKGVTPFTGPTRRQFDFVCSMLDAAILLGAPQGVAARMPSVRAPVRAVLPAPAPGTRLRIGICWAGNPKHANDVARSCELDPFLPLLAYPGIELLSLQVGARAADIAELGAQSLVTDLSPRLLDYGDTAAAIAGLDLVVTVDTSVAHLAGALGKPVWVVLPALADWRWTGRGDTTAWYPSMRLFRQAEPGDWASVFTRVEAELVRLLAPLRAAPVPAPAAAEAARLHHLAMALLERDDNEGGIELFAQALRHSADPANSWNNMGVALRRLRRFRAAEIAFRRALAVTAQRGDEHRGALGNLANALTDLGRLEEAKGIQARLMVPPPDEAPSWHNWGLTLKHLGEAEAALAAFDRALELDSKHVHARWDRSHLLMERGDWERGWPQYEVRWSLPEAGALPDYAPVWQGEDLAGKTVVVLPEQGFGDTLFAVRYLKVLKDLGARVMLQCQPELMRLLSRVPWIDVLVPKFVQPPEPADYQVACMSLPAFARKLGIDDPVAGQPYLAHDPTLAAFAGAAIPTGRINIGVIWTGSLTFKGNAFRRAGLADFLPLAADPRLRLFALQKGPAESELEQLKAEALVRPLGPLLTDFDMTAAALQHLDGVIMTDSSTAHLAGALGCPVWVLLGDRPYWLYGKDAARTRWYDSLRLVRRGRGQSWSELILAARDELVAHSTSSH